LHTFLRHPLHIFSSGGPPPTRTHPGPIRSRVEPAGESRHCWDAVAILFAGPPSRGITIHSAGSPHPARASGAPPPPPPEEGVRAWRYLVESRVRVFPGLSPCSGPWWISPLGERLTGRGDVSPLPCLQIPILRFVGIPHGRRSARCIRPRTDPNPPIRWHPPLCWQQATHTPLPAPSTPPAPSPAGYPYTSAGSPHPARAFGAPPPPRRGGGSAWRYLVESRIRVFPGLSPCSGPWWISPLGERLTGRGDASPLPCLSRSRHLAPCQPHPARAFGAPPPPRRGGGSAWRYQGSSRIRGATGGKPCTGPWGYRHGGWGLAGRGNSFPLPCLSRSKHLASRCRHFCEGYPYASAGTPTPPAPSALRPRPAGAVAVRGDIRGAAVSGVQPGGSRALDRGDIATGGGGSRGGGTRSPSPVSHAPDTLLLASPIPPGLQPAGYPYTPPTPPPLPSPDLQLSGPGCKKKWVPPGNLAGNGAGYDVCCFPKVERLDWCVPAT